MDGVQAGASAGRGDGETGTEAAESSTGNEAGGPSAAEPNSAAGTGSAPARTEQIPETDATHPDGTAAESAVDAGGHAEPPARPRGWRRWIADTRPLRRPAFRRLWTSTAVTAVGSQLTAVAVPKQVYDITGSSAAVGYSSIAGLIPLVVFGLWGGAIADAVDRRKLMLVTNTGIAVTSALFWLQAFVGLDSVPVLMILLALQQAFFGINQPTRSAAIARLVPRDELPAANALGSTVAQTGMIVGPLLAGALIPLIGLAELYLIDALALCCALWAVWRLPALPPLDDVPAQEGRSAQQGRDAGERAAAPNGRRRRAGWRELSEGFRYIGARQVLLLSFVADIIAMVFGMPRALFPQLAATTYAPWGEGLALGLLYAAIPIGAVAGGLFSGTFSRARSHGWMVVLSVVGFGAAVAGFGWSPNLWWAVGFLAAAGVADMISMVFRQSILQAVATDAMRGRMQGAFTVVVAGGPRVADLVHGTAGAAVGPGTAAAVGGVLVVVLMLALAFALPSLRRYRI